MDELLGKLIKDLYRIPGFNPKSVDEVKGDLLFSKEVKVAIGEVADFMFNKSNQEFFVRTKSHDKELTDEIVNSLEEASELALDYTNALQNGDQSDVPTFKVGDKVRVRSDLEVGQTYGTSKFTQKLAKFRGEIVEVTDDWGDGIIVTSAGVMSEEMVEPVSDSELEDEQKKPDTYIEPPTSIGRDNDGIGILQCPDCGETGRAGDHFDSYKVTGDFICPNCRRYFKAHEKVWVMKRGTTQKIREEEPAVSKDPEEPTKKSFDDIILDCIKELKAMGYRCESGDNTLFSIKAFKSDTAVGITDTSRVMYNPADKKFRAITTHSNIKVTDEVLEDFEMSANLADKFNEMI